MVELKAVERIQAGTEATYKSTHEAHRTTRTVRPISDTNASQLSEVCPVDPDNPDKEMAPGWLSGLSGLGSDNETPRRDSLAGLSGLSGPPTLTLEFSPPTTTTAPLDPVLLERLPESVVALGPEADAAALADWLHRQHGLNATAADVMAALRVRAGQPPSA
ncbi:MAG: hypothetical protein NTW83_14180 [Cyanobacteria bacterium]|nr:hypothetical protein [Cyanobacteriota bacterium]